MKNLRILSIGLMMTLCSTMAWSQAEVSIGIKGGLNFADMDVSNFSTKNKTGFHGGAFALFKFTKIGIQPELIFSQQGSEFNYNGSNAEANFSYINIPVIFKLYTVAGINIQAGPQFGFLSKAEIDGSSADSFYKSSDFSLGLGLGWDLPFRLTVDARYNLGLSEIEDGANENATKNQVWQLSVGYKLFKFGN